MIGTTLIARAGSLSLRERERPSKWSHKLSCKESLREERLVYHFKIAILHFESSFRFFRLEKRRRERIISSNKMCGLFFGRLTTPHTQIPRPLCWSVRSVRRTHTGLMARFVWPFGLPAWRPTWRVFSSVIQSGAHFPLHKQQVLASWAH